jgi:hypothetical protein
MAKNKATDATETKATDATETTFSEVITGTLILESVDVDDEGVAVDTKVLTVAKGKTDKGTRYQASFEGVSGKVAASITAAINDLLEKGLKVLPSAWAVPKNEKEVKFPEKGDNRPKDPESIEDLSAEMAEGMRAGMADLVADFAAYKEAESRTRGVIRSVATRVRDLRAMYTKAEFGIFCRIAPAASDVAKLLSAKNTLGEFVFYANIPEALFALMPEGKTSPKAAQAWVNGLRGTLAHTIVGIVKANADLSDMGATDAVRAVVADHVSGAEPIAWEKESEALECLLGLHVSNWPDGMLFDGMADGSLAPARDEGKHATASLFGSEGADELVKALCGAFNGYQSPVEKAEAAAVKARAKGVAGRDFLSLSADEVALHLFNVLAGRIDEGTEETLSETSQFCLAVLDKMGGWMDCVADGTMTVGDVLKKDAPESEDAAEEDADAAA